MAIKPQYYLEELSKFITKASSSFSLIAGVFISLSLPASALSNESQAFKIVKPPVCLNYKNEQVQFITTQKGRPGVAAGMANKDKSGNPVIYRSNFSAAPKEFQNFIDRHECAHHQTGDVDRPHPPRNGPEHLMNESIADCIAILTLRDEESYNIEGLARVVKAMRNDMEKIGFPEISVSSRISNVTNCFNKEETADQFVKKVLNRRGLLKE